nr:carboxypeptidase-like regulatory domain-containing protein [uncultured Draconibacterium sp.]
MSTKKSHIDKELFRRYLANEMTDVERNAFEKELQKYPFEAEAMDGFESVSSSNFENDLNELSQKTGNNKRKSRIPYFAAAATILLLITSGIIWMQLSQEHPTEKVSEVKIDKVEEEVSEPVEKAAAKNETEVDTENEVAEEQQIEIEKRAIQQPAKEKAVEAQEELTVITLDDHLEIETEVEDELITKITPVPEEEQAQAEDIELKIAAIQKGIEVEQTQPALKQRSKSASSKGDIISGQVLSDSDGLPLPGVTVVEKGTDNGTITDIEGNFQLELENDTNPVVASFIGMESTEFHPQKDSDNIITLTSDDVALSEVVVVGYGTQKKSTVTGSTTVVVDEPINSSAAPICGMNEYRTYLNDQAVLPTDFETKKVVVKLRLTISSSGEIQAFENMNNANTKLFERAKNIVLDGPDWTPAFQNNRKIESRVRLRVVFKKSDN